MRPTIIKVILLCFSLQTNAYAIDTIEQEKICSDIGFKKKTPSFANCVLELMERKSSQKQELPETYDSYDPDDASCRSYVFNRSTNEYAICRQQIDLAKQQAQRQQAQYEEQKRQYEAKVAEIQKEKDRKNALRQAEFFLRWGSGENITDAARGAVGLPPMPKPPAPQTIFLPGGKAVICTTTGNTTSCF